MEENSLKLYGKTMTEKEKERYLGDFLHKNVLSELVKSTVKERINKLTTGIPQIRSVVEDCRSIILGGITIGLDIWKMVYIPSLLNNSSTWMEVDDETIKMLDDLQDMLYRSLLSVPVSTPRAALAWDCGGIKMHLRIKQKKLNFLNYMLNQSEGSLAKQILFVQREEEHQGLYSECKGYLEELNLPDPFAEHFTQKQLKLKMKFAIIKRNENELKDSFLTYKKLRNSDLINENFGRKEYLSSLPMRMARVKFSYRCSMMKHVKMCFRHEQNMSSKCGNVMIAQNRIQ